MIGPFKISADNYHAVVDSALCVYKQCAQWQGRHPLLQIWTRLTITRQHIADKHSVYLPVCLSHKFITKLYLETPFVVIKFQIEMPANYKPHDALASRHSNNSYILIHMIQLILYPACTCMASVMSANLFKAFCAM